MQLQAGFWKWVHGPLCTGRRALLSAIVVLTAATSLRAAVDPIVTGCEFTPFLPFILLSAILLRWWQAALVAMLSAGLMGVLFVGLANGGLVSPCFLSSSAIFLGTSAVMIGGVFLVRQLFRALYRAGDDEAAGGVVFSLEDGEVWASWYGQGTPVLMGSEKKVSAMMKDFLAQVELGKRLNGKH